MAFRSIKDTEREAFIEKVVSDSRLRDELIDIALIEEAKSVKGKTVSAREYFKKASRNLPVDYYSPFQRLLNLLL